MRLPGGLGEAISQLSVFLNENVVEHGLLHVLWCHAVKQKEDARVSQTLPCPPFVLPASVYTTSSQRMVELAEDRKAEKNYLQSGKETEEMFWSWNNTPTEVLLFKSNLRNRFYEGAISSCFQNYWNNSLIEIIKLQPNISPF